LDWSDGVSLGSWSILFPNVSAAIKDVRDAVWIDFELKVIWSTIKNLQAVRFDLDGYSKKNLI